MAPEAIIIISSSSSITHYYRLCGLWAKVKLCPLESIRNSFVEHTFEVKLNEIESCTFRGCVAHSMTALCDIAMYVLYTHTHTHTRGMEF